MLFVGLGNPGSTYEMTRHNIGFRVIDKIVSELNARDIAKSSFCGKLFRHGTLFLLKPATFMNMSGKSVLAVKQFFKIDLSNIVVIHDDIDLPFGAVRIKKGGGNGGHNGLRSIDEMIGKEYLRVRIGIGKPEYGSQVSDFVLHNFSSQEEKHMKRLIEYLSTICLKIPTTSLDQIKSLYSIKDISKLL